jgi:hypothetical protein
LARVAGRIVIMNALKLYRDWDERRGLKWAGWWERRRADGRSHYVRWAALGWGGAMINVSVLWDCLNGGGFSFVQFAIMTPLYLAGGWLLGTTSWSSSERRYQKYLTGGGERQLKQ